MMDIPLQPPFDVIFTILMILAWSIYLIAMFNNLYK